MTATLDPKTVSKRINVTLPDKIGTLIEKLAANQGRSVSSMAAYLLQKAVDDAREKVLIKDD